MGDFMEIHAKRKISSTKKILLIAPLWNKDTKSIFHYMYGIFPPLGIALIASILEKDNHRVEIIDCSADGISPKEINKFINDDYDFVGISVVSQSAPAAYEIAKEIKTRYKKAIIIIGGVHASAMPEEIVSNPYVDICVRGEGEESIREVISGAPLENIKGISYRKNGSIIHNPDRETIPDLDIYPLPAYHLLPMKKYRSILGVAIEEPSIGLVVSRGCPGRCEYCFPNSLGRKVRIKKPQRILEEILLLKNTYGVKEIDFYDDTFTFYKDKIIELCDLLIKNKIKIVWSCLTRVDFVDEGILKQMKEAGCHQLMYGVESGSEEIRKKLNKNINVDFKKVMKMTQRIGIQIRATYMIGNYAETYNDVLKTIKYAKYLDSDLAIFNVCTPFPGTELYKRLEIEGRILTKDWGKYDFFNVVFSHPNLSAGQITSLYKRANLEFYLRPIFFMRQFRNLCSFTRARLLLRIVIAFIKGVINWVK